MSVSYTHSGGFITTNRSCDDLIGTGDMSVGEDFTVSGTALLATATGLCGSAVTAKSQLANGFSGALVKNTVYLSPADGNQITATLPTAASSTKGDVIVVEFHAAVSNGQTLKFGTSGEFFMAGSVVYIASGAAGHIVYGASVADGTTHDFLNLIGLTNAGPGIASKLVFSFNGSKWSVSGVVHPTGDGGTQNLSAFATT